MRYRRRSRSSRIRTFSCSCTSRARSSGRSSPMPARFPRTRNRPGTDTRSATGKKIPSSSNRWATTTGSGSIRRGRPSTEQLRVIERFSSAELRPSRGRDHGRRSGRVHGALDGSPDDALSARYRPDRAHLPGGEPVSRADRPRTCRVARSTARRATGLATPKLHLGCTAPHRPRSRNVPFAFRFRSPETATGTLAGERRPAVLSRATRRMVMIRATAHKPVGKRSKRTTPMIKNTRFPCQPPVPRRSWRLALQLPAAAGNDRRDRYGSTSAGALGPEFAALGHTIVYGSREPGRDDVVALVERTGQTGASATTPAEAVVGADMDGPRGTAAQRPEEITRDLGDLSGRIISSTRRTALPAAGTIPCTVSRAKGSNAALIQAASARFARRQGIQHAQLFADDRSGDFGRSAGRSRSPATMPQPRPSSRRSSRAWGCIAMDVGPLD